MNGFQPGDAVRWQVYGIVHTGTVLERFNSRCLIVDRGQTYSLLGTDFPDRDVVAESRLRRNHARAHGAALNGRG